MSTSESIIWFRFQEVKYVFDNDRKSFLPILFPVDCSAAHYTSWTGLSNNNELETAQQKYGLNKYDHMSIIQFITRTYTLYNYTLEQEVLHFSL